MTDQLSNTYFQKYFDAVGNAEAPLGYHRWAALGLVGALLGRQAWFPMGDFTIYPNMYTILVGSPAARKSTAVNLAAGLLKDTGYDDFAPHSCSKEAFIKQIGVQPEPKGEDGAAMSLEELMDYKLPCYCETFVHNDEFINFTGRGDMDFIAQLSTLWDNPSNYFVKKIGSKDVMLTKPTVNLLSATTAESLAAAYPPEIMGQGFTSRVLLIVCDETGKRVTWPTADKGARSILIDHCKAIKKIVHGAMTMTPEARALIERVYESWPSLTDYRFANYSNRRQTHFLKLITILAAADLSLEVHAKHVLQANTILHYAECRMPEALASFGNGANAKGEETLVKMLGRHAQGLTREEITDKLPRAVGTVPEVTNLLRNLVAEKRVLMRHTDAGTITFTKRQDMREIWDKSLVLTEFLYLEEMQ